MKAWNYLKLGFLPNNKFQNFCESLNFKLKLTYYKCQLNSLAWVWIGLDQ